MHGAAHDGIEQGRRIAAMHGAERIIDRLCGRPLKRHETFFRRNGMEIECLDDTRVASLACKDCLQLLQAREPGEFSAYPSV